MIKSELFRPLCHISRWEHLIPQTQKPLTRHRAQLCWCPWGHRAIEVDTCVVFEMESWRHCLLHVCSHESRRLIVPFPGSIGQLWRFFPIEILLESVQKSKVKLIPELDVLDAFPLLLDPFATVVRFVVNSQSKGRELCWQLPLLGSKQVVQAHAVHPLPSDYSDEVEFFIKVASRIVDQVFVSLEILIAPPTQIPRQ